MEDDEVSSNIGPAYRAEFAKQWYSGWVTTCLDDIAIWALTGRRPFPFFGFNVAIDKKWVKKKMCKDGKTRHYLTPAGKLAVVTWRMTGEIPE